LTSRTLTSSDHEPDMVSQDLPQILDAAQVAELLGMNVQMVRRYAREGRLPAYKLPGGRTFKFFRDEIFDFVRSHPVIADLDAEIGS
nr:helix-turn-helix domain-containing protein [Actinomycetota bacterium]